MVHVLTCHRARCACVNESPQIVSFALQTVPRACLRGATASTFAWHAHTCGDWGVSGNAKAGSMRACSWPQAAMASYVCASHAMSDAPLATVYNDLPFFSQNLFVVSFAAPALLAHFLCWRHLEHVMQSFLKVMLTV